VPWRTRPGKRRAGQPSPRRGGTGVSLGTAAGGISADFILHVYDELLAALPGYSEISVAVQARDQTRLTPLIARMVQRRPLTLHVIEDAHIELDLWAQDLGESFRIDGEPRFLMSAPIAPALAYDSRIAHDRALVARTVFGPRAVVEADFVFEGGNVMLDRTAEGFMVLIGYNDLWLTTRNDAAWGHATTLDEAAGRVSARFGGYPVVRMGNDRQSRFLPHIDESFVLLADRTAVLTRLPGGLHERHTLRRSGHARTQDHLSCLPRRSRSEYTTGGSPDERRVTGQGAPGLGGLSAGRIHAAADS
jgi:hypothetical protein